MCSEISGEVRLEISREVRSEISGEVRSEVSGEVCSKVSGEMVSRDSHEYRSESDQCGTMTRSQWLIRGYAAFVSHNVYNPGLPITPHNPTLTALSLKPHIYGH